MATSGSTDLSTTRDAIITEAAEYLAIVQEGASPNASQVTAMSTTLNWLVKHIQQAHGGHLFGMQQWYLFLKKNQTEYNLAQGSTDKFCRASTFVNTFTSAVAAATDTTIEVDSITDLASGDDIGVEVASNVVHWTTINGAPSGTTVTLTDALPAAVAIDAQVYTFTDTASAGDRFMPLLIQSAHRRTKYVASSGAVGTDIPITAMSRDDFKDLSVKSTDGAVNQFFYDRQRMAGTMSIWPQTSDETDFITMWVQRPLEDFDAAGDEPDYPQEWFLTLAYNLAKFSLVKYGTDQQRSNYILGLAEETLKDSLASDTELMMQLRPDERGL